MQSFWVNYDKFKGFVGTDDFTIMLKSPEIEKNASEPKSRKRKQKPNKKHKKKK